MDEKGDKKMFWVFVCELNKKNEQRKLLNTGRGRVKTGILTNEGK